MKQKHLSHLILYCLALAFSVWLIGFAIFCVYAFSLQSESNKPKDAVVVLTGGSNRIGTAIDVFKKHHAKYMLISGVNKKVTKEKLLNGLSETEQEKITLGYEAENTVGNAQEINNWIQDKDVSSILLITSFYHMPRSIFEIGRKNPALKIAPWPVFPTEFDQSVEWIKTRYAWQLLLEYHKFIFVQFKSLIQSGGF